MDNSNEKSNLFNFSDLSVEELRNLQLKLVNLLNIFEDFCKDNHLRYFLAAGTCLGAVRHHKFIPWDDDLDLAMPRDDFEKLFKLWNNNNNRYQLLRPSRSILTGVHIGQLRDSETTCIYEYARNYDICHGIKIDIEPIDGCPDNKFFQSIQKFFCSVYGLMSAQRVPNHASNSKKYLARVILSLIPFKTLRFGLFHFAECQIKKYKYNECNKLRYNYGRIMDKSIVDDIICVEFEGKLRPIPKNYDNYLKIAYGDYMKFPPLEKRKPETRVYFYDLYSPYHKYKGLKYCCSKKNQF